MSLFYGIFNILSLDNRRRICDMIFLKKILSGHIDCSALFSIISILVGIHGVIIFFMLILYNQSMDILIRYIVFSIVLMVLVTALTFSLGNTSSLKLG